MTLADISSQEIKPATGWMPAQTALTPPHQKIIVPEVAAVHV